MPPTAMGSSTELLCLRSWPASDREGRRPACQTELHLRLLGHFERIVDFDAQVPYGTF